MVEEGRYAFGHDDPRGAGALDKPLGLGRGRAYLSAAGESDGDARAGGAKI
jgi:hypothetical protein